MPAAKKGDPVNFPSYPHEVLSVVLSVRDGRLCVLLWKRARDPHRGRWALPGGGVEPTQRLREAITAHLATKVDVRGVAHLEQLATHSAIDRDPRARVLATAYLGLVPSDVQPELPSDTVWHPVDDLPPTAFDHHYFIDAAVAGCAPNCPTRTSASRWLRWSSRSPSSAICSAPRWGTSSAPPT